VFSVVLPGAHPQELEPFALFLFCGILPWTWFSSSLVESANVLITGGQSNQEGVVSGRGAADRRGARRPCTLLLGLPILAAF
jgi:hypothetical protein